MSQLLSFANSLNKIQQYNFVEKAIELFHLQYKFNTTYRSYVDLLKINPNTINTLETIPFLPISFFKTHQVKSFEENAEVVFESSATTGQIRSKHFVYDLNLYKNNCKSNFEEFYGPIIQYDFYALLPSYLERNNSSLVYMVDYFMEISGQKSKSFYLNDFNKLSQALLEENNKIKVLFGVSFALLDFAEKMKLSFKDLIVIETGGMKGKRQELIKSELHNILKKGMKVSEIHSEYGMTELMSQFYAQENGEFRCPTTLKIILRNATDPFDKGNHIKRGGLNIIDLANVYSCAFIETQDLASLNNNSTFSILGRMDNSDVRGCSLMYI